MRICRIATIPFSLIHNLGSQLDAIVAAGHELHLVCSRGPEFETLQRMPGVTVHAIEMARMISPIADLRALVRPLPASPGQRCRVRYAGWPKLATGWLPISIRNAMPTARASAIF